MEPQALTPEEAASRAGSQEAENLAREGKVRCRYCKKIEAIDEVLTVFFRGNILFSACPSCFRQYPIVMKHVVRNGSPAVFVGPLRQEDRPSDIVVVSGMDKVKGMIGDPRRKPRRTF
jgi:hypothetical protein